MSLNHDNSLLLNQGIKKWVNNSCKSKSQGYGNSKMATWIFPAPWQTSFLFDGLKPSLATGLMPSQWQKKNYISLDIKY